MARTLTSRPAVSLALASLFVALALATNYALINIPNVKLMDVLVFAATYKLGLYWGTLVAAMTWIVYGTLNPYGTNLIALIIVITGEMFYVIAGVLLSRLNLSAPRSLVFSLSGGLSTLAYDLFTNALTGVLFYGSFWTGLVVGVPMGLIHETSNVLFFAIAAPPLLDLLSRGAESKIRERPPAKAQGFADKLVHKLIWYLKEPWGFIISAVWAVSFFLALSIHPFSLFAWTNTLAILVIFLITLYSGTVQYDREIMIRESVELSQPHERRYEPIEVQRGLWPTIATVAVIACITLAGLSAYLHIKIADTENRVTELESLLSRYTVQINLLINFGNGTRMWYNNSLVPLGSNLINLTIEAVGGKQIGVAYSEYGAFVTSISGIGDEKVKANHIWLWWAWNSERKQWEAGQVGADSHKISDGEVLAWYYQDTSKWPELETP